MSFTQAARLGGLGASMAMLGLLIGAMAVILPPMAAVGAVGIAGAALIWAMPEIPWVPRASLRKAFLAMLFAQVCIPGYYAGQISGLPWISLRRLAIVALIFLFSISVAASRAARARIVAVLSGARWLAAGMALFLFVAFASIFFSQNLPASTSQFVEICLNWGVPFLACILVVESEADMLTLWRAIACFAILVTAIGVVEFVTQHRIAVDVIPKGLLASMMDANPSLADLVNANPFRNGFYRASSIFNVPLSFGEFAAMAAPIGGFFVLHGERPRDRVLGATVLICAVVSLFVSGSRGGSLAFLLAMPTLACLWIVRYSRMNPRSLVGAIGATVMLFGLALAITLILTWKRLSNVVIGGGDSAASNDGRLAQWTLAWPHILDNPIAGHGVGMAGEVINYHQPGGLLTVDSYVLTLLVDTGVPGLILFAGVLSAAFWMCARLYVRDEDTRAAFAGPLACSILAFAFYRLVLSQQENHTLLLVLVGAAFVLVRSARERADGKARAASSGMDKNARGASPPSGAGAADRQSR